MESIQYTRRNFSRLLFLIVALLFSGLIYSDDKNMMQLRLSQNSENNLILMLSNISSETQLINKRMSIGPSFGPLNEVAFVIENSSQEKFPLMVKINLLNADYSDMELLDAGKSIEKIISFNTFVEAYELKAGSYTITSTYKNRSSIREGVFSDQITSNTIKVNL